MVGVKMSLDTFASCVAPGELKIENCTSLTDSRYLLNQNTLNSAPRLYSLIY